MKGAGKPDSTMRRVRQALAFILVLGMAGTGLELLLLRHTEDFWQLSPIVLIGAAGLVMVWHAVAPGRFSVRALQMVMGIFLLSGIVGVILHYRGNVEWELERLPGTGGLELFKAAMMGATPSLAPGTMAVLGLLGLLFTYRHPALRREAALETGSDP